VQLKELPGRLSEAAASIRDAGGVAAQQHEKLSASIQEAVKANGQWMKWASNAIEFHTGVRA
jgi:hypothetical protein